MTGGRNCTLKFRDFDHKLANSGAARTHRLLKLWAGVARAAAARAAAARAAAAMAVARAVPVASLEPATVWAATGRPWVGGFGWL